MSAAPVCVRCFGPLNSPGLMNSAWRCDRHGAVLPLEVAGPPRSDALHAHAEQAQVPVWLPWPLPKGWVVTGLARAGDARTGIRAVAVACSGPAPLGGQGELVIVAEDPGTGLGACFAGMDEADPGPAMLGAPSTARVSTAGHPTAVWAVGQRDDRAAYVGEAHGLWLWTVLWPADAGHLLADDLTLVDLRDHASGFEVPCGALSPHLPA